MRKLSIWDTVIHMCTYLHNLCSYWDWCKKKYKNGFMSGDLT